MPATETAQDLPTQAAALEVGPDVAVIEQHQRYTERAESCWARADELAARDPARSRIYRSFARGWVRAADALL